ncbi:hypothetical protein HSB1_08620 [Halogranum salarium B-1]|uniref:Uncharacterized protein n=1 Tax=Halogranum salarium B-1 TaxID=1210908 RepID=J3JGM3_9EURY|nr:hypothetical protein HSB1_08620 [Halogranum salarium B-1]
MTRRRSRLEPSPSLTAFARGSPGESTKNYLSHRESTAQEPYVS